MTQEAWFKRLSSFIPRYYTREENQTAAAFFWALAKCLEAKDAYNEEVYRQTLVDHCDRDHLEVHAFERGLQVKPETSTTVLRQQVKRFSVPSSKPEIMAALEAIVGPGSTYIRDWYERPEVHLNRGVFLNRGFISVEEIQNTFIVFINKLTHKPTAFVGRSFASRADFVSAMEVPDHVFDNINETVESMKALGTEFAIIER